MTQVMNNQKTQEAIIRVHQAIKDIQEGKMVVMVDDEDRENEGDLVYAASLSTPEKVNFMASQAKGLICVSITKEIAQRLSLAPMVSHNSSSHETAFTVSVDAKEATTGISAYERDMTIQLLANPIAKASDLVRPGHIFPLIAKEGGVLVRIGHTEGSVDLCRLAGLREAAVICEIMKEDGSMARRPDLDLFCERHDLNIVYISDLVEYRMFNESLITMLDESVVSFMGSDVKKCCFSDHAHKHHYAYVFGELETQSTVKFHQMGLDQALFENSKKYDHLMNSIAYLKEQGGVLVFMNSHASCMEEVREYGIGAQILKYLGLSQIKLISTSLTKEFKAINGFELEIVDFIQL